MYRILQSYRVPMIATAIAIVVAIVTGTVLVMRGRTVAPAPAVSASLGTATTLPAPPAPTPTPSLSPCNVRTATPPPVGDVAAAFATALAFAPDGRLFIAERDGNIRVASGTTVTPFATVATVTTESGGGYSERGLLGLAISPTFATDRYVYAFVSLTNRTQQQVLRWTDCNGVGVAMTVIVTLPSGTDCCHKGGRIAFGSDAKLYVTLGDEHDAATAQNSADARGKVLRFNPDGSVPADNPFGNAVWAYGLRNPFGIAFAPDGTLFLTGNGPSGDASSPGTGYDLATTVTRGEAFQWPYCYGYSHRIGGQPSCAALQQPEWSSEVSTFVPTGAAWVDSQGPAAYANHFVFCTYTQGMLVFSPGAPHATVSAGPSDCRLAVVEGPDHALYFSDETVIHRIG